MLDLPGDLIGSGQGSLQDQGRSGLSCWTLAFRLAHFLAISPASGSLWLPAGLCSCPHGSWAMFPAPGCWWLPGLLGWAVLPASGGGQTILLGCIPGPQRLLGWLCSIASPQ